MTAIAIRREDDAGQTRFRAAAGDQQAVGRTLGEALDALTAQWGEQAQTATVLVPGFHPDAFFTQAQHDRMQALFARRDALTPDERAELEGLVNAELAATIERLQAGVSSAQP